MGGGGFAPFLVSAPALVAQVQNQVNGALLAIVTNSAQGQVAKQGNIEIPLPQNANLPAGTTVRIEIVQQQGTTSIRITPQPQPNAQSAAAVTTSPASSQSPSVASTATGQPATPPAPNQPAAQPVISTSDNAAQASSQAVRQAAQQLSGVPALIRAAAQLTPGQVQQPTTPAERVSAVLNVLPPIAPDIQVILSAVQSAGQARLIPQAVVDAFVGMFSRVSSEGGGDWQHLLRQAVRASTRSIEGRIATAAARNQAFTWTPSQSDGDLRAALLWLVANRTVRQHLAQQGMERPVLEAAARMWDRLAGAQVLNAHAGDAPYLFLDLPLLDSDVHRAQIHIAGDGHGNAIDPNRANVILDLELSELGALWISLNVIDGHCMCHVRAKDDAAQEAIDAESEHLSDALTDAGYRSARVQVQSWDGDRVEMLQQSFAAGGRGMDVSA